MVPTRKAWFVKGTITRLPVASISLAALHLPLCRFSDGRVEPRDRRRANQTRADARTARRQYDSGLSARTLIFEFHPIGISRASKVSLRAEVLVHSARHHQPVHPFQIARLLLDGHCRCHAQSARIAEGLAASSKALRTCRSSSTPAIVADTFGPDTRMNAALPRTRLRIPL